MLVRLYSVVFPVWVGSLFFHVYNLLSFHQVLVAFRFRYLMQLSSNTSVVCTIRMYRQLKWQLSLAIKLLIIYGKATASCIIHTKIRTLQIKPAMWYYVQNLSFFTFCCCIVIPQTQTSEDLSACKYHPEFLYLSRRLRQYYKSDTYSVVTLMYVLYIK